MIRLKAELEDIPGSAKILPFNQSLDKALSSLDCEAKVFPVSGARKQVCLGCVIVILQSLLQHFPCFGLLSRVGNFVELS